jgi:hypothetical protein
MKATIIAKNHMQVPMINSAGIGRNVVLRTLGEGALGEDCRIRERGKGSCACFPYENFNQNSQVGYWRASMK